MKKTYLLLPFLVIPFLFGCNKQRVFNITFDAGEGYFDGDVTHKTKTIQVRPNDTPVFKETPEKAPTIKNEKIKYTFNGWSPVIAPATADATYVATYDQGYTYYTVTFESYGCRNIPAPQDVMAGRTAGVPKDDPVAMGGSFQYWTEEDWLSKSNGDDPDEFNFTQPIEKDITLYPYFQNDSFITVTFDAGEGHFNQDPGRKRELFIVGKNTKYKDIDDKPTPILDNYDYNGFSFEDSGIGKLVDPNYSFTESKTIYASYSFHMDGDVVLSVGNATMNLTYGIPLPSDPNFKLTLNVKDEYKDHYIVPLSKEKLTITDKDYKAVTEYNLSVDESETQCSITMKKALAVNGLIITCDNTCPTYSVSIINDHAVSHLRFTKTQADPQRGYDYSFVMDSKTLGNATPMNNYRIPDTLTIYVGESGYPLPGSCYKITPDPYSLNTKATVTIFGKYVKGNITVIDNEAIPVSSYGLNVISYGFNCSPNDFIPAEGTSTLTFTPVFNKYSRNDIDIFPEESQIFYSLDYGTTWNSIATATEGAFTYNKALAGKAQLTIDPSKIDINGTIQLVTRSEATSPLDSFTWDEINAISEAGLAKYAFRVGETKKVNIQIDKYQVEHKVRIIDFEHDDLATGNGKAGITFEFATLLSTSHFEGEINTYRTLWQGAGEGDGNNRDFINSDLNKNLNDSKGQIYNVIPSDLKNVVKNVNKNAVVYSEDTNAGFGLQEYQPKFFPLSIEEINDTTMIDTETYVSGEGTAYKYYETAPAQPDLRLKKSAAGESCEYWIRSPIASYDSELDLTDAFAINRADGLHTMRSTPADVGLSPAFCI